MSFMETGLSKVTLSVSLLKVASCVSSVSQLIRVTFVFGEVPNTASKSNRFDPIPCFSMFTFTVVSPKSGAFAGDFARAFAGPPNRTIDLF